MIKSMTGYGKAERDTTSGKLTVEIRSVNHRYCEVSIKLPRAMQAFENEIKKVVTDRLKRGKIDLFVKLESNIGSSGQPVLNIPLAAAYNKAFISLREALGLHDSVTLALIAAQKDVITTVDEETVGETFQSDIASAVNGAVDSLEAMREQEGDTLLIDISQRIETLEALVDTIEERAPQSVADSALRLKERVSQLLSNQTLDEARIAQEIAIMADRCDITEELVRFRSHIKQVGVTLKSGEPVGRKLDFLLQELNREVNTIGSKANNAEIALNVVSLKSELEKIREQIQNIE